MSETIYNISLRYEADDRASKGLASIARNADRTSGSLRGIRTLLLGLGSSFAFVAGKRALIDYNNQIDQMKIGMATVLTMQMHKPFELARKEADLLVERLQEIAKKSPATTKDFVEMANMIAPAVAMMGGGVGKLQKLTEGAVIAGMATGTRADVAGLDIQQMLMGTVSLRDRMARQLLSSRGIDYHDFNKKTGTQRAETVESLLQDPALKRAAEEFGNSFSGVTSTLKDQLQIALGKVGLPLMKEIGAEVKKINTWMDTHPVEMANIMRSMSEGLKTGFGAVKAAIGFLVDHKDTILQLAKAFLVLRGIQMGVGAIGGIAGSLAGSTGSLIGNFKMLGNTSAGLGARLQAFGGALTLAAVAAAGIEFAFERAGQNIVNAQNRRAKFGSFITDAADMTRTSAGSAGFAGRGFDSQGYVAAARRTLASAREDGILDAQGRINDRLIRSAADTMPEAVRGFGQDAMERHVKLLRVNLESALAAERAGAIQTFKTLQESAEKLAEANRAAGRALVESIGGQHAGGLLGMFIDGKADERWKNLAPDRGDLKVTIHKIEIASEDPDRFVFGMVKAFERAQKEPASARDVIVGGF